MISQARSARDRLDRAFAFGRRARRFVWPALVVAFLGAGGSIAYALLRPRSYRSEAVLLCKGGVHATDLAGGATLTRGRLEQIIKQHHLYATLIEEQGLAEAVDELRRHVALRAQDGEALAVGFEGSDPERVRAVTAALADAFVADGGGGGDGVSDNGLPDARERGQRELEDRERALAQFLSKHPEFARESAQPGQKAAAAAAATAGVSVRPANAARPAAPKVDTTLAFLERETARLQERLDRPVTQKHKDEPQADPQLVAAKQQADNELAKAQRELADKQGQFTDEHPDVRAARVRLQAAQEKAKRAGDAVGSSVSAKQRESAAREAAQEDEGYIDRGALENQLKRIKDEIVEYKRTKANAAVPPPPTVMASSVVALETEWVRLNQEVADARERARAAPTTTTTTTTTPPPSARTAGIVVIDPAYLPTHEAPPARATVLATGFAATALLSLLLTLGLALVDDRIYDRHDIERLGMLPLIGAVPRARKKADQGAHG